MSETPTAAAPARVYLKPTWPEDIDDTFLQMYAGLDGKNRWFRLSGKEFSRDELVEFCRRGVEYGNVYYYSVCAVDDDALIGSIRIGPIDFKHSLSDMVALIGDVRDRGKGLGTEAIRLGLEFAFQTHNIRKVSGGALGPNIGSLKAYIRAGWVEEGRLRDHYLIDGEPVDWIVISCLNPDWRARDSCCNRDEPVERGRRRVNHAAGIVMTALPVCDPGYTIHVLCPSPGHPVNQSLAQWAARTPGARVTRAQRDLPGGDFLFLVSCGEIVGPEVRDRYRHVLTLHAADLPRERGWSPHVWAILDGRDEITVTLAEACDRVDSGPIWHQVRVYLGGAETYDEINAAIFTAELDLMDWAISNADTVVPTPQNGEPTGRRRRTPADSEIRAEQTIAEVFDLLRVCDPERFPAFFHHRGQQYELVIRKAVRVMADFAESD